MIGSTRFRGLLNWSAKSRGIKIEHTLLAQSGLFPVGDVHVPITPAINATTVIARDIGELFAVDESILTRDRKDIYDGFYYGGVGTPTGANLIRTLVQLEGAEFASLAPSGQSAIAAVMFALVRPGDHVLAVDTTTYSTRWFLERRIAQLGIEVEYYPPGVTSNINRYFKHNTRLVFMESPGSFTYEMQDVAAIASACKSIGAHSVLDNTWSACSFFKPFECNVDISVVSLSKSAGGLNGMSLGVAFTNCRSLYTLIANEIALCGLHVSADSCAGVLAAMSSLAARLERQQKSTAALIDFFRMQSQVGTVFHPSIEECDGYALWRRDFTGGNSLISVSLRDGLQRQLPRFFDALRLFRIGYGWGGALSLVSMFKANQFRSVSNSLARDFCLRFYIGLESPDDLIDDLRQAFACIETGY